MHWDGIEYWDASLEKGVLFRLSGGTVQEETQHNFLLSGLRDEGRYRIHFEDGTAPDEVLTGRKLRTTGLSVRLEGPLSSEIAFIESDGAKTR